MEFMRKIRNFREMKIFAGWTFESIRALYLKSREQIFEYGQVLLEKSKKIKYLYFIKEGEVTLTNFLANEEIEQIILEDWQREREKLDVVDVMFKKSRPSTARNVQVVSKLADGECLAAEDLLEQAGVARYTGKVSSDFLIAYLVREADFLAQYRIETQIHRRLKALG